MSIMKVRTKDAEGIAKQVDETRQQILDMIDEARDLLDPPPLAEGKQAQNISPPIRSIYAAMALSEVINGLATLVVSQRWQDGITKALAATTEMDQSQAAVSEHLKTFIHTNAARHSEAVRDSGPIAAAFSVKAIETAARAAALIDMMINGHNKTEAMCVEYGLDFVKVQEGDKVELAKLVQALTEKTGMTIDPRIATLIGLTPNNEVSPPGNIDMGAFHFPDQQSGDEQPDDETKVRGIRA